MGKLNHETFNYFFAPFSQLWLDSSYMYVWLLDIVLQVSEAMLLFLIFSQFFRLNVCQSILKFIEYYFFAIIKPLFSPLRKIFNYFIFRLRISIWFFLYSYVFIEISYLFNHWEYIFSLNYVNTFKTFAFNLYYKQQESSESISLG